MEKQAISNNCIFVLCGIPGSGKSTLAIELAKTYKAKLYSYDDIIYNSKKKPDDVRAYMLSSIKKDLQEGFNVIMDDSNILIKLRAEVLTAIDECESKKTLIVMNTPLNICLLRNANRKKRLPDWVINHMHRKYQSPTIDEGWDKILYY